MVSHRTLSGRFISRTFFISKVSYKNVPTLFCCEPFHFPRVSSQKIYGVPPKTVSYFKDYTCNPHLWKLYFTDYFCGISRSPVYSACNVHRLNMKFYHNWTVQKPTSTDQPHRDQSNPKIPFSFIDIVCKFCDRQHWASGAVFWACARAIHVFD